jgi:peptide-methionine (R)-S-oxide reductase
MQTSEEVPKALSKEDVSKISDEEWKKRLTPEQFAILRKSGTERSNGQVYKEFKAQGGGTYFCAGCNTELFSSKEKFDSKCGWPSFYDPSQAKNVKSVIETDGSGRIEVRCATCDGHLGHVFKGEGFNTPTDQRYCINGTVLKFVPAEAVEAAKVKMAEEAKKKEAEKKGGE